MENSLGSQSCDEKGLYAVEVVQTIDWLCKTPVSLSAAPATLRDFFGSETQRPLIL